MRRGAGRRVSPCFAPSLCKLSTHALISRGLIGVSYFCVSKKPINRKWGCGQPMSLGPAGLTEFEQNAHRLGLTLEMYAMSAPLRDWCERNRNRCYVPEWLLKAWKISVDLSFFH